MDIEAVTLHARLSFVRDDFVLDLVVDVAQGEAVVLLGPNGAGKTTTLRVLAGLTPRGNSRVVVDGETLDDAGRVHVPPEHRPIGVVFQDYLLFPHLTALDNVAFGLRARGMSKAGARDHAGIWLERVGLASHARAKPRTLSGGQAQRVALARALAAAPRLLLLDEPLAALDAGTREDMRSDLHRHLAHYDGSTVLVTHDPLDAMVLADRVAVVEEGRLVQQGSPAEVARHPRTDYVARLVGLNLYRGQADRHRVRLHNGAELTVANPASGRVFVAFPPSAVALHTSPPHGSPRNTWAGRVAGVERHRDTVRVSVDGTIPVLADVTTAAVSELGLLPGAEVWVAVKATETRAYPA